MMSKFRDYLKRHLLANKRKCVISIGDIFLSRGASMFQAQFLAISRFIDVKRYYEEDDYSFTYKNTICKALHGEKHNSESSNNKFKILIDSIGGNGFNPDLPIILNNDGNLIDGNHRCGISLYFKIEFLTALINVNERNIPNNIDNFINIYIPTRIIANIYEEFTKIQQWLIETGHTFAILLNNICDDNMIEEFISKIKYIVSILRISKSDIGSVLIQFSVENPKYEYSNGFMISKRCYEIEWVLRRNFPAIDLVVSKSCVEGHKIAQTFRNANRCYSSK